ncbi:hypothetical protein CROQUDRAFT_447977 [Cronartium quercuum f. sp. fusiforme G11]|uniref:Uncharacterized protein n=1 Tax=Cronartium quercuum f. sp. fusiforme G11 TaxID=708437 RepID=A0A9P6TCT6_9BASI|nr:hypothetical protein CROQUDRAFT_447977 [Cronartium quercuum f. sp. fusiforme G11]
MRHVLHYTQLLSVSCHSCSVTSLNLSPCATSPRAFLIPFSHHPYHTHFVQ